MARYDKYDGCSGGFRALLAADFDPGAAGPVTDPLNKANFNKVFAAVLNASGQLVAPAAFTTAPCVGVFILSGPLHQAGDAVDIMTNGEIVNFDDGKYAGVVAAQDWYVDKTSGLLTHTAPAAGVNAFYVGTTVEAGRLVVRYRRGAMVGT